MTLAQALLSFARPEQVLTGEPMSRHTTFRVGGPAEVLFLPESEEQLVSACRIARESGSPLTVIGNGSNLLVKDGGIPGLTIRLGDFFSEIHVNGTEISAQAGALLSRVSKTAQENGLAGLEFASGIPGSVGGGMAMNAGAYGGQLSDIAYLCRVLSLTTLSVSEVPAEKMALGYRTSAPLLSGDIVTRAHFRLQKDDPEAIQARMDGLNQRRRDKQPLTVPSAGSTFKRPEGHFAGALIEQAGLKGARVGGAQVSEKHAGFIVNAGGATASDVLSLIALVQARVFENSGVNLEPEVRILGVDKA